MLIDRTRKFLLMLFAVLLAGCGGGGGNPGTVGPPPAPPATGSLAVVIASLPAGVEAAVRVTGPGDFAQDLTQSRTLPDLAPGTYSIAASSVASSGATWVPSPPTQSAVVTAGATTSATVSYASTPLALAASVFVTGLDNPTFLGAPPGDPRQFVTERPGRVRIVRDGTVLARPFLDLGAIVATTGEGGLLSIAFDPDYARNGFFYVYFTDPGQNIVVARYSVSQDPDLADPTSSLEIIRIAHPVYTNHFGGLVAFGTDGLLYLGTGDGGGAGDPQGNAQDPGSLLGKLLRIDVSAASAGQPYAVPPTNPWAGQAGRRGEVWAWGLRNPWRYAFDGSALYIADVGQDRREEVDLAGTAQAGLNYGWNVMEGSLCFNAATCDQAGLVLPAFEYDHGANDANGCAITGGYVYRGTALPELAGRYFYSDYCTGFLKSFYASGGGILEQRDWGIKLDQVVSFGQDGQGELYLVSATGSIHKIVRGAAASR